MKRAVSTLVLCLALLSPAKGIFASDIEVVRARVFAWGKAWQSQDIDYYMSFYSPAFRSKKLDYQGWGEKKAQLFKKANNIKVEISDLWVFIERQIATASFVQRYYDQNARDVGEKTLILVLENNTWKIISEEWKPLKMPVQPIQNKTTVQNIAVLDTGIQKGSQHDQGAEIENRPRSKNIVKSIKFEIKKDLEKVFIKLNRFLVPKIMTLEGDKPRIVVDIMDVSFWGGQAEIPVNGKLIRRIRTYLHHDVGKLRIVLDLNPADDYMIDQTFDKAENIYCIAVK